MTPGEMFEILIGAWVCIAVIVQVAIGIFDDRDLGPGPTIAIALAWPALALFAVLCAPYFLGRRIAASSRTSRHTNTPRRNARPR